eukprot:500795_1
MNLRSGRKYYINYAYSPVKGQPQHVKTERYSPMKSPNKPKHQKHNYKSKSKPKTVKLRIECKSNEKFNTTITINGDFTDSANKQKSQEILDEIEQQMHKKYNQTFSVVGWTNQLDNSNNRNHNGPFVVWVRLTHDVSSERSKVTCPNISEGKTCDTCHIYENVKEKYEFSEEYYAHLNKFTHYKGIDDKPLCRYMDTEQYPEICRSYARLLKGGNRLDDRCHMQIYKHPPRNREISMSSDNKPFVLDTSCDWHSVWEPLYKPTNADKQLWKWSEEDGYLHALIDEIIQNGFENNLIISDEFDEKYGILSVVKEKMNHHRHKALGCPLNRGEMLSIILYTGSECNWYLTEAQMKKNSNTCNDKWKWFEYLLDEAIKKLHENEGGDYKIYTGLRTTNLVKNKQKGKFTTFVSASWEKDIAMDYMNLDGKNKNGGMIIEMKRHNEGGIVCADVSWISKFADECEVLIKKGNDMSLSVEDMADNFQNVKGYTYGCGVCRVHRSIVECLSIWFE